MLTEKHFDCTLVMWIFRIIKSLPYFYFKMLEVPLSPYVGAAFFVSILWESMASNAYKISPHIAGGVIAYIRSSGSSPCPEACLSDSSSSSTASSSSNTSSSASPTLSLMPSRGGSSKHAQSRGHTSEKSGANPSTAKSGITSESQWIFNASLWWFSREV